MPAATLLAAFTAATSGPAAVAAPAGAQVEIATARVATAPAPTSRRRPGARIDRPRAPASEPVAALARTRVRPGATPALPLFAPTIARRATAGHSAEGAPIGVVFALPWLVLTARRRRAT